MERGGQGEPTQQEPELKSRQPQARDPQPHPERERDLKPPGDGTRETDQGPEGETEKKTRPFQERALLETSERQALRSWERE